MKFQEILPKFLEGQKIKKTNWKSTEYVFINNKNVIVDEKNSVCHLQGHNLVEDDWEIYDDRGCFDWNRALELMEEGNKVSRRKWDDFYIWIEGGMFMYNIDNDCDFYNIKSEDCKAIDWYLVEEE